jgi:hypothetical protein
VDKGGGGEQHNSSINSYGQQPPAGVATVQQDDTAGPLLRLQTVADCKMLGDSTAANTAKTPSPKDRLVTKRGGSGEGARRCYLVAE